MRCRIPFLSISQLEGINKSSLSLATSQIVKMKANTADAPYVVQKGALTNWQFSLTYATVDQFLVMAHEQLAASRLPYADRKQALQVPCLCLREPDNHPPGMCCCKQHFVCTQSYLAYVACHDEASILHRSSHAQDQTGSIDRVQAAISMLT